MTTDKSLDALMESLTLEEVLEDPKMPLQYWQGDIYDLWWYSRKRHLPQIPKDAVYRNANGAYHRLYGPAYVSRVYEIEAWYKNGKLHREDGPAYIHKSANFWFLEGKLHRLNGPAVDKPGHPKEFWINGQKLPPKEYKKEITRRIRKGLIK